MRKLSIPLLVFFLLASIFLNFYLIKIYFSETPKVQYDINTLKSDNLTSSNLSQEISKEQLRVMSKDILEVALKRQDHTITLFSVLMTFIVSAIGALLTFMQYTAKLEFKDEVKKFASELEDMKKSKNVEDHIDKLFASKYRDEILKYVSELTLESLHDNSELRDKMLSRLRTMTHTITNCIEPKLDEGTAQCIKNALIDTAQLWHTLGLLYSSDRNIIIKGLGDIMANPSREALKRLAALKERYKSDPDLFPLINEAIKRVEEHMQKR
ncbi:MAG: hypothetical protein HQL06_11900 [Nitrospirae bacterium]|nr:hypothetical protein [Nitrospirota bacterium]